MKIVGSKERKDALKRTMNTVRNIGIGSVGAAFAIVVNSAVEIAGFMDVEGFNMDAALATATNGFKGALILALLCGLLWIWLWELYKDL